MTRGLIAALLLLATGCTGSNDTAAASKTSAAVSKTSATGADTPTAPAAAPKGYDPPAAFAVNGIAPPLEAAGIGRDSKDGDVGQPMPIALHGTTAYIAAHDSLQIVDTATGTTKATIRPP